MIYQFQRKENLKVLNEMMIKQIEDHLRKALTIKYLDIIDESPNHGGYDGSISHLKLIIVSDDFQDQKLLVRHKTVYDALGDFVSKIHAISLSLKTENEWTQSNDVKESPPCSKNN